MNIRTLFITAALACSLVTAAQGDVVSRAYEVALDEFLAPATENGAAAFKPCSNCQQVLVRVTPNTRYLINGQIVRLDDFRRVVGEAHDRDRQTVTVLHHLESDTVISIDLLIV